MHQAHKSWGVRALTGRHKLKRRSQSVQPALQTGSHFLTFKKTNFWAAKYVPLPHLCDISVIHDVTHDLGKIINKAHSFTTGFTQDTILGLLWRSMTCSRPPPPQLPAGFLTYCAIWHYFRLSASQTELTDETDVTFTAGQLVQIVISCKFCYSFLTDMSC